MPIKRTRNFKTGKYFPYKIQKKASLWAAEDYYFYLLSVRAKKSMFFM